MPSSPKPPNCSTPSTPPPLTTQKRKAVTGLNPTETNGGTTPTNGARTGVATTDTPHCLGSAQRTKEGSGNTTTSSRVSTNSKFHTTDATHSRTCDTPLATPEAPKQLEMDRFLELEMQGAIFCDPNFVENFLTVDSTRLQTVLEDCEDDLAAFRFQDHVTRERQLYDPICQMLNIVKQAVDGGSDFDHLPAFLNVSAEPISSHYEDMAGIKPDLVLFEGTTRHWETVRMPIEVKRQATYLKTGMKQLTRYARAVFAHQIHRRHLYGLVICKWEATFVRFDRSGILYSRPIDMCKQREVFCKAFAGLMLLDEEAFGYDTAFRTRARRNGRLEFYVDLPANSFPPEEGGVATGGAELGTVADASTRIAGPSHLPDVAPKIRTRRLRVVEKLCHRKSIRGRATIVLRVREVIRPGILDVPEEVEGTIRTRSQTKRKRQPAEEVEVLGTRDYVLKLMWRDPGKKTEGEVLERLVGIYGVAQCIWHSDAFKMCDSPGCGNSTNNPCGNCLDMTPGRDEVWVTKNLTDLDIEIPGDTEGDEEPKYKEVKTDEYSTAHAQRTSRIYCRLLMSTVGSPLCTAESPRRFLQAVLDAILGYWRLVNKGLLHRDISDGNVLMLQEGHGYSQREWRNQRVAAGEMDSTTAKSEKLLQDLLEKLDRDPGGILNDFDLFATDNRMGALFFVNSSSEDGESVGREAKRRKLNDTTPATVPSSQSAKGKEREASESRQSSLTHVAKVDQGACKGIDFRTGTPTFMSQRVLRVPVGQRYQHCFMDDLESFFWLILWCVVEHVDTESASPENVVQAQGAAWVLNLLDQSNLGVIAAKKGELLGDCVRDDGDAMKDTLASCKSSWAADPMIVELIVKMGAYFFGVSHKKIFTYKPVRVFPKIVDMIVDALDPSGSSSSEAESD
ncbi:hypothetical protein FRC10_008636 [Ceratobasidium sp. 414]|nr:hypothetical protein FRC10_008636 [Ceratobasidium sp. 414]